MSTIDSYTDLKDKLEQSTDDKYRDFTMKICPSKHSFLGVRVPQIRKLASGVPKEKIEELLKYLKFIFAKADKLSTREEYYVKNEISVAHLGMFYQVSLRHDGLSINK